MRLNFAKTFSKRFPLALRVPGDGGNVAEPVQGASGEPGEGQRMSSGDVLVIGLGYVGLPLALQAVRSGFRVTGYDTSAKIAASLMAGRSHVDDVTDAE